MNRNSPTSPSSADHRRPSIIDVAKEAGVSIGTVSRILSGRTKGVWASSAERAGRVRAAAEKLGYTGGSWSARAFARGRTNAIAVLHVARDPFLAGNASAPVISDLFGRLFELGYETQLLPVDYAHTERGRQLLAGRRYDGAVVVGRVPADIESALRDAGIPVVAINADAPAEWPSFRFDDVGAGRILAGHLLGQGHRVLAFIALVERLDIAHASYRERIEGIREALAEAGLPPPALLLGEDIDASLRAWRALRPRPTAAICFDDRTLQRWHAACWRAGVRLPEALATAAFNDSPATEFAIPPATTMRLPTRSIANAAADCLVGILRGASPPVAPCVSRFPLTLVVRESTPPKTRQSPS